MWYLTDECQVEGVRSVFGILVWVGEEKVVPSRNDLEEIFLLLLKEGAQMGEEAELLEHALEALQGFGFVREGKEVAEMKTEKPMALWTQKFARKWLVPVLPL